METPTIEAERMSGTIESPTLQSTRASTSMETPTVKARLDDRTLETPTLSTARLRTPGSADERASETAEIDLDELGLDLTGLDAVAGDMATGLHEAVPEDKGLVDLDLSAADIVGEGDESTAEMARGPGLDHITNAMGKKDTVRAPAAQLDETVEQPAVDSSMITRGLGDTARELEALRAELDLGDTETSRTDASATMPRPAASRQGPGDQTMTEVGTKLDLARAYLDMGDPDGARSILNEVLEEGDLPQRQEARQLLDSMNQ
jgi:pilus assembly protein FimV